MDQSSPIEDCDREDDSQESQYDEDDFRTKYVIRLTPMEKYTAQDLEKFLTEQFEGAFWVFGVEKLPQVHFHLVLETTDELKDVKCSIRTYLFDLWPERHRGWGNAQYNCQKANENTPGMLNTAASYALKDKEEYHFLGYAQEYIDRCIEESYKKKTLSNFKLEYKELCDKFKELDCVEWCATFLDLKGKYGQQVKESDAFGFWKSNSVNNNGHSASVDLMENYLCRQ